MFPPDLLDRAKKLLAQARAKGLKIATAESCTGGLLAGLLTEIPGSSDVFERGFVTYSNAAKQELLGVPLQILEVHGAVSEQTAHAMAEGALKHSLAHLAIAVTGIAGPSGGTDEKPVGRVHLAFIERPSVDTALENLPVIFFTCHFGDIGRTEIRLKSIETVLQMLEQLL
jgi:nicotinamide-nucleotide amidase